MQTPIRIYHKIFQTIQTNFIINSKIKEKSKMALTFKQQLNILSKGFESIIHDCPLTKIIHYHFIGAPFRGLVSHDIQRKREEKRIEDNLNKHPKKNKIPLKISYNDDEGWKMVYEIAELSIAETYVVEEVIKKQRVFLTRRVVEDHFDPNPYFESLDREINFGEEAFRVRQEMAKQRNKLMHALNGNIIQVGDKFVSDGYIREWSEDVVKRLTLQQYMRCFGIQNEDVDYVSLLNELDLCENKKVTIIFELITPKSGMISMMIREERIYASGNENNKKKIKALVSRLLLQKLMKTFYFALGTRGRLDMKFSKIFPEEIPTMQSVFKENTKRDNKTRKHSNDNRSLLLKNKGLEEYGRRHEKKEEFIRLHKIYQIQQKQEEAKTEKLIAQLQGKYINDDTAQLQWSIPVNVKFEDFQEFVNSMGNFLSDDVKKLIDWASVANCLYIIYTYPDLLIKLNACDNLRRILGVKVMSAAVFAGMVLHLFKHFGFITHTSHPSVQTFDSTSTMSILITLIMAVLYRNNPKASTVEVLMNSCKDLSLATRGVGLIEEVVQRVCNYVRGVENLDNLIPQTLKKIEDQVKRLSTKDGISLLTTDEKTFVEICKLRMDVINVSSIIDNKSVHYQKFLVLKGHVNNMYTIAQRSPVAGCGRRKKPVVFHVWGDAGIGKSRIIKLLAADTISTILSLEGYTETDLNEALEAYDQYIYYRPVGVQYEQNFVSSRAKIYVCDDANQVDAKHLQQGTPFPQAIIHLNNEHDHMLPVAELEMKSQALFKSALIIATDNKQTPDLSYLQCPEAYHRRIDFSYKMILKPEFSKDYKGSKIVDISALDITQPNEHIYEFHSGGRVYSYENVVALVRNELKDVHKRFKDETVVFKMRAQKSREEMKEQEEAPEYVADTVQNAERPSTIERMSQKFRQVKWTFDKPPPRLPVPDTIINVEEKIPTTQGQYFMDFFSRESERTEYRNIFQTFLATYIFVYLPISWSVRIDSFMFNE
jgi:hypothetical protein